MKITRQLTIQGRSAYLFTDITNINDFDPSLLNIDKVSFRNDELTMYDIMYIKNLNRLNTLYLVFNNLDGVFQRSGENKHLIFSSAEKNRITLESYTELFDEIAVQIELMTAEYSKDIMEIKFKTSDDLPFGEKINIPVCVIIVSSIFKEINEYHPQVLLNDCFYEYTNPLDM